MMRVLVSAVLLALLPRSLAWSTSARYATSCPERCRVELCSTAGARCEFTLLDDCGCCSVCAARRGEPCYRTVSAMNGVKCGPGLFCHFYKDEDEYGEEYGVCKDCPYGTYGVECRKNCNCKGGGLCDRETGACLSFKFYTKLASKLKAHEGNEVASGDGDSSNSSSTEAGHTNRSPASKLAPR